MRKSGMFFIVVLCLLLALPVGAQDSNTPKFESAPCMFTVPKNQNPECGYLTVPEDRSQPNGRSIQLAVAVFHSDNPDKMSTPIIYLEGGPGGSSFKFLDQIFDDRYAELLKNQDVILFDQRGVGYSKPALDCQEVTNFMLESLDKVMTVDENIQAGNAALTACATRLTGEGVNLAAYTSAENASDVNDLRLALGYDQLDLYGISYGTRLALTIMRDHPEGVRSAIIDSILPLQASYDNAVLNFERSLNVLFKNCAAEAACSKAFPDLKQVFFDTIDQLNAKPATFTVLDPNTHAEREVKLDGDSFAGYIFQALYATQIIPSLPKNIYDVHNGDTRFLSLWTLVQLSQLDEVSTGMNYAVNCSEELAFDTTDSINKLLSQVNPKLVGFARRNGVDPSTIGVCSVWNKAKPNPIENEPVKSAIPTLLISGEYDPITPPEYGKTTAASLSNGYFFEIPSAGHGVIPSNECAFGIAESFLKDPTTKPDSSCIASLKEPAFTIAAPTSVSIEFETYTNESLGFTAVKPKDWTEAAPGTFGRGSTPLDTAAISYQVLPGGNVDLVIPILSTQFGIKSGETPTIREANGLKWRLLSGEVQKIPMNIALTDANGKVYMILMLGNAEDQAALYEGLFLPAIDAFKPKGS